MIVKQKNTAVNLADVVLVPGRVEVACFRNLIVVDTTEMYEGFVCFFQQSWAFFGS